MLGTIVNVGAIVTGSLIGGLFRKIINEKLSGRLMSVMGLAAFGLGINAVVQNMPKRTANTIASRPTKRINAKIKAEIIFVAR